ncbi:MAG: thiamine pyrophosphate-dependent enzyme, partial [Eubacteriales bacterium]|nr:thiamine pyrophosphate-dependent enzyme [Eubacteriales bacterium]
FISNSAIASMGYDLPAAIGACAACHDVSGAVMDPWKKKLAEWTETLPDSVKAEVLQEEKRREDQQDSDKAYALGELETARRNPYWTGRHEHYPAYYAHDIICPTGDGSIMMNLQELQTISSHRMPIKIFLVNNGGYHSIRQTQHNLFHGEPLVGIGVDSRDLSFPDFEKVAKAFDLPFVRAVHNSELQEAIEKTLSMEGPVLCEIIVSMEQNFEPKSATKRLPDGTLVSPPLEDLAPFLSEEELDRNMIIKRVK